MGCILTDGLIILVGLIIIPKTPDFTGNLPSVLVGNWKNQTTSKVLEKSVVVQARTVGSNPLHADI